MGGGGVVLQRPRRVVPLQRWVHRLLALLPFVPAGEGVLYTEGQLRGRWRYRRLFRSRL